MTAEVIGEAEVLITADFSTFDDQLKAKLVSAAQRAGGAAEKILKQSGTRSGKAFSDGVAKASDSQKTIDAIRSSIVKLESAAVRAGDSQVDAASRVRAAEAALAKVKRTTSTVTLDGAEKIIAAEDRLAKARRSAARADQTVTASTTALLAARGKLDAAMREQASSGSKSFGDRLRQLVSREGGRSGEEAGGFFGRAFRTAAARSIGTGLFRTLAVSAGGLLTALSPLSTLLGGATAAIVALSGAILTASGSALSLGGVLGSLGLAAAALKVGFSGVGDAMKAQSAAQEELARTGEISTATQEKLDAALADLAPTAAAVVRQLSAMAPAWQAVQRSVQERLFAGVSVALANLGNRFLPVLNRQLTIAATTLNQTGLSLARFLNNSSRAGQINSIFAGLNGILRSLLAPLNAVTGGFLDIFQASLPFARDLANVLSTMGANFGQFLSQAASGGGFARFMETATALAQDLFRLLGNVGSILGQVFAAGNAAGGGLLNTLANLTGQFSQFLRSAEGQASLASFFGLISTAGEILVGVFQTLRPLLAGIGSLFDSLQGPISVLGAALTGVFGQLATTIGGVLTQLGPVLGQLVVAVAPLVTILGGVLSGVIAALAPVILQLVQSFTALLPTITPIVQILGGLLVTTLTQLSGVLVQILPVLAQLIAAFLTGLAPVLSTLAPVLTQIVGAFLQLITALLPVITSLLPIIPAVSQLTLAFAQLLVALAPLITTALLSLTQLIVQLAPYIAQLVPPLIRVIAFFTAFTLAITKVVTAVVGFAVQVQAAFNRVAAFVARSVAAMVTAVVGFVTSLVGKVKTAMDSVGSAVSSGIDAVLGFFRGLPGKITGALGGLKDALFQAGSDAVAGLANGITSKAGSVLSAARDLASKVSGAIGNVLDIGSPSKVTHQQGEDAGQGLANGLAAKVKAVGNAAAVLARAVPDKVEASFQKLNNSLASLGAALPGTVRRRIAAVAAAGRAGIAALERASDGLDARLKTSQTRLQDLLRSSQQLAQSVSQAVLQSGNIAQGQDSSFTGIVDRLRNAVTQAKQFATVLASLRRAGLNSATLQQIAEAGPEAGTALGQSLLRSGVAGLNQVNRLQTQLTAAAAQAAKTASDAVFGQGIRLAQGLVAGLTRQRTSLDRQMTRLADVLVARVVALLRALKIPGVNTLNIPGFADGGVVGQEQVVRVAERNRREAIIPLTKPRRARQIMDATGLTGLSRQSGGKSRTVEVPINVAGNVVDYDALTAHIAEVLQRFGFRPVLGLNMAGGTL